MSRTCYNCRHSAVCFLRRSMDKVIEDSGSGYFEFTNPGDHSTPGFWQDLFVTTAGACRLYKERNDHE